MNNKKLIDNDKYSKIKLILSSIYESIRNDHLVFIQNNKKFKKRTWMISNNNDIEIINKYFIDNIEDKTIIYIFNINIPIKRVNFFEEIIDKDKLQDINYIPNEKDQQIKIYNETNMEIVINSIKKNFKSIEYIYY